MLRYFIIVLAFLYIIYIAFTVPAEDLRHNLERSTSWNEKILHSLFYFIGFLWVIFITFYPETFISGFDENFYWMILQNFLLGVVVVSAIPRERIMLALISTGTILYYTNTNYDQYYKFMDTMDGLAWFAGILIFASFIYVRRLKYINH